MTTIVKSVYHATKVDTLQNQIQALTHQVDSLNKVSNANTIHTAYFHDIINSQVMTFSLILTVLVALPGIISWRWISSRFREIDARRQTDLLSHRDELTTITDAVKDQTDKLKKDLRAVTTKANILIYNFLTNSNEIEEGIAWGISAIASGAKDETVWATRNLTSIKNKVENATLNKEKANKFLEKFKRSVTLLREEDQFMDSDELRVIENLYYKAAIS